MFKNEVSPIIPKWNEKKEEKKNGETKTKVCAQWPVYWNLVCTLRLSLLDLLRANDFLHEQVCGMSRPAILIPESQRRR